MQNVGSLDRIVRLVLAAVAAGAGLYFQSWWGLLGLVPAVTALVSWCPLYALFGLSSCELKGAGEQ